MLIPALDDLSIEDGAATLAAFTAKTIVDSLDLLAPTNNHDTWILAGGGWNNPAITKHLSHYLKEKYPNTTIARADDVGWQDKALEAQIFAYLALRRLDNLPASYPSTTGCKTATLGGNIHAK